MQVAFGFTSPLVSDKCPNRYGQKTIAIDPTGAVAETEDEWRSALASVGGHLLMLAGYQGIIDVTDLDGLALGQPFTLCDLVKRRSHPELRDPDSVGDMYGLTPC